MCELGVDSVETLFLALPEMPSEESLQILKAFWEVRIFFFNGLYKCLMSDELEIIYMCSIMSQYVEFTQTKLFYNFPLDRSFLLF